MDVGHARHVRRCSAVGVLLFGAQGVEVTGDILSVSERWEPQIHPNIYEYCWDIVMGQHEIPQQLWMVIPSGNDCYTLQT